MPENRLLFLLKRLRVERNSERREKIIELGRRTLMRWFLVGAKNRSKKALLKRGGVGFLGWGGGHHSSFAKVG